MIMSKYDKLQTILKDLGSVIVAYSGGVDSTFLLKAALDTLGPQNVLAVTADSESYPTSELREAIKLAEKLGSNHQIIEISELAIPGYKENTKNRCYFCKKGLFEHLEQILQQKGYNNIIFGLIADDINDYRPGSKAAIEYGVRAPLQEAGLYKEEIRELSKRLNLETWDKPSYACLSSRIAYGEEITDEKLRKIEKSEDYLKGIGFRQVRVRTHGDIARIEVEQDKIPELLQKSNDIVEMLKSFGYKYVTVDLSGYKSGSMNAALNN